MNYSDGTKMNYGDWGWHQPDHISGGTPYYMRFDRTLNGMDGDPCGLFSFHTEEEAKEKDKGKDSLCMYWTGSFSKTREEALEQRALLLEKKAAKIREQK